MARTIRCPHCNAPLNLPDEAWGRRVKCPKCSERFVATQDAGSTPVAGNSAPGASPAKKSEPSPDSTLLLTKNASSVELPAMPSSEGNLRETFDLPMMTEAAVGSGNDGGSRARQTGDATALFEDKPVKSRPKRGAEARATARRCPTCGGHVPQGMSLCSTCGLDLDTGLRTVFDEDLISTGPSRQQGLPLPVTIVGGASLALSFVLCLAATGFWMQGADGVQYFIPIAAFGIFASIQFLKLKNTRLLLVALSLGALIDLAALVAMPVYQANAEAPSRPQTSFSEDDPDSAEIVIQSIEERLDLDKIKAGLAILAAYAAVSIYIISPPIQRHFRR